jgi:hypothetical protein
MPGGVHFRHYHYFVHWTYRIHNPTSNLRGGEFFASMIKFRYIPNIIIKNTLHILDLTAISMKSRVRFVRLQSYSFITYSIFVIFFENIPLSGIIVSCNDKFNNFTKNVPIFTILEVESMEMRSFVHSI